MKIKDIKGKVQTGSEFWMKVVVDKMDRDGYIHFNFPTQPINGCAFKADTDIYDEVEIKDAINLSEVTEMTVEEICKALGKTVKIVK